MSGLVITDQNIKITITDMIFILEVFTSQDTKKNERTVRVVTDAELQCDILSAEFGI